MAYELEGKIKLIRDEKTFGANGFKKREFIVTVESGKYPQNIALECLKDRCATLDKFREGDHVRVKFNVQGNEYNGKYYNALIAWSISGEEYRENERSTPAKPQTSAKPSSKADEARNALNGAGIGTDDSGEIPF